MSETTFNWRMLKQVFTECHVYDEVRLGWVGLGGGCCATLRCGALCGACYGVSRMFGPAAAAAGRGGDTPTRSPTPRSLVSNLNPVPVLQEHNYVPFDYKKEEPLLAWQRKVLPDTM